MTSLQELYDIYVRPLNLRWQIDDASRRHLFVASTLPALIIAAQLTEVALVCIFSQSDLYYPGAFGDGPGEFWERLYRLSTTSVQALLPAAIAVLFLAGIRSWTRAEGSWMFLIGAVLASSAVLLGVMATFAITVTEDTDLLSDLRVDQWFEMARTFGLLSIGFLFVAYRGLATDRRVQRPRRPKQPEGLPDESTES